MGNIWKVRNGLGGGFLHTGPEEYAKEWYRLLKDWPDRVLEDPEGVSYVWDKRDKVWTRAVQEGDDSGSNSASAPS